MFQASDACNSLPVRDRSSDTGPPLKMRPGSSYPERVQADCSKLIIKIRRRRAAELAGVTDKSGWPQYPNKPPTRREAAGFESDHNLTTNLTTSTAGVRKPDHKRTSRLSNSSSRGTGFYVLIYEPADV